MGPKQVIRCFSQGINHRNWLGSELEIGNRVTVLSGWVWLPLDPMGEAPSPSHAPELSCDSSPGERPGGSTARG